MGSHLSVDIVESYLCMEGFFFSYTHKLKSDFVISHAQHSF